jgi:hypothetical protein
MGLSFSCNKLSGWNAVQLSSRAGADRVVAAEISQHICDVGCETVVVNGFGTRIMIENKDSRRMDVVRKPDGMPPELERKADLLVYEVRPGMDGHES